MNEKLIKAIEKLKESKIDITPMVFKGKDPQIYAEGYCKAIDDVLALIESNA